MNWYHGTPHTFDTFDPAHLGKGNDQLGSGFYFTDNKDTANGYSMGTGDDEGRILVVQIGIENPMPQTAKFSREVIANLLRAAPDFDDMIYNFGDVSYEGFQKVLKKAVDAYYMLNDGDDALRVLNAISNDFWRDEEALFLRQVYQETGYDGLIRTSGKENHAVVWLPERIKILDVIPTSRSIAMSL